MLKKNITILILASFFYIFAVAAGGLNRHETKPLSEFKRSLVENGYEISYEVSVAGNNGIEIEFYSASGVSFKNVIHVAVFNDAKKSGARVSFDFSLHKPSENAEKSGASLVINGGYFANVKDKIYSVGQVCKKGENFPFYIAHDQYPYFCVFETGVIDILKSAEFNKINGKKNKIRDFIQTKPLLVYDSKISPSLLKNEEAQNSKNPRSSIGLTSTGRIICVVAEGRNESCAGMTQVELAGLFVKLGASKAINLDGGGSSAIVLNGIIMNKLSGGLSPFTLPGHERPVHSVISFGGKK